MRLVSCIYFSLKLQANTDDKQRGEIKCLLKLASSNISGTKTFMSDICKLLLVSTQLTNVICRTYHRYIENSHCSLPWILKCITVYNGRGAYCENLFLPHSFCAIGWELHILFHTQLRDFDILFLENCACHLILLYLLVILSDSKIFYFIKNSLALLTN